MISTRLIAAYALESFPHFSGLNEDHLRQVALISEKVSFEAGGELVVEEAPATHFCRLKSGAMDVMYTFGDNRKVAADVRVVGDAFGWSALLQPHRLTASCVGSRSGECIRIEGESLRKICDENPGWLPSDSGACQIAGRQIECRQGPDCSRPKYLAMKLVISTGDWI